MEEMHASKNAEERLNDTVNDQESLLNETPPGKEEEAPVEDAPDEVAEADLQQEVEKLTKDLAEARDKHLRLYSEFENFRRRTAKERLELIRTATEDLMISLLPVLDDFERAQKAADANDEQTTAQEGMDLIYQKLLKELGQKGLKPMDTLIGQSFDAEIHEAISQIPAPKKKLRNCIVDVVEKGYYLNDKVIRYAKVVIGT